MLSDIPHCSIVKGDTLDHHVSRFYMDKQDMLKFIREQLATAVTINNKALQVMAEATYSYLV